MNRQKFKQTIPYLLLGMFTLVFLLVFLRKIWCIWLEGRLDQSAQRTAGLFPAAVL